MGKQHPFGLFHHPFLQGFRGVPLPHFHRFLQEDALTPARLAQLSALDDIAAARGQTLAQMALAWLLARPGVTGVLIGASRPAQIIDDLGAIENLTFSPEELAAIDRLSAEV